MFPALTTVLRPALAAAVLFLSTSALSPAAWAQDNAHPFSGKNLNPKATDFGSGDVTLEGLAGKTVLLNFWATWCGPCKLEMPHLDAMYQEFKDNDFVVVSVSIDDARDKSQIKPTVISKKLTFPVIHDADTSIVSAYNPTKTLPFTVIIDGDGKIRKVHQGYTPGDEVTLREEVMQILGLAPAGGE